jgi:GDPmannose 4,6-dehydratase
LPRCCVLQLTVHSDFGFGVRVVPYETIYLGNIDSHRDWGHARDYVEGMWRIMQQEKPDDFVLATGETHTVKEFCELAFKAVGVALAWRGEGVEEVGYEAASSSSGSGSGSERVLVRVDPAYFRPTEVELLLGQPAKAKAVLGWTPTTPFPSLVEEMVKADLALVDKGDMTS